MFGIDLFWKSAATTLNLAQKGVENMFKMMDFYAGLSGQCRGKQQKTADTPEQPESKKDSSALKQSPESQTSQRAEPLIPGQVSEKITPFIHEKQNTPSSIAPETLSSPSALTQNSIPKAGSDKQTEADPDKITGITAIDQITDFIAQSRKGVTTEDIMKETGFSRKKVQNIIYKLKKREKIITSEKGLYVVIPF